MLCLSLTAGLLVLCSCRPNIGPPSGGGGGRGGGTGPGITPAAAGKPQFPAVGSLFGSCSYPWDNPTMANRIALWNRRDADAGRPYDISNNFYRWDLAFPGVPETEAISHGRTPMVSWNGTTTSTITSGQSDTLIRTRARALRDLHVPVLLRFFWEMDGHKGISLAGTPANFIAAWRYVHQIFVQEGAANVAWVWAPTNLRFGGAYGNTAPAWYPGDDVVDWIGADGYNWAPDMVNAPYESFQSIFANFYAWASTHDKPLMVGETGVEERNPGEKAQWIRAMATTLKTTYTRIKALVYFDLSYPESGVTWRWPVDSTPETYAAWNGIARDPYFNTRG